MAPHFHQEGEICMWIKKAIFLVFLMHFNLGWPAAAQESLTHQPTERIYRFDFGPENSPLWPGFIRVTRDTKYSASQRFGWRRHIKLEEGSSTKYGVYPDPLAADWIRAEAMFHLDVPSGEYKVWLLTREIPSRSATRFSFGVHAEYLRRIYVKAEGGNFFDEYVYRHLNDDYRRGQDIWNKYIEPVFKARTFAVDVTDGKLALYFHNCPVTSLIVYPANQVGEMEEEIKKLQARRRKSFPYSELKREEKRKVPNLTEKQKERGYVLFKVNYLDKIYPTTVPESEWIGRPLEAFATPGEYEPVSFAVYPLKDLKGVKIKADDLTNSKGDRISRENIDVRIVRYMECPVRSSSHYKVEPLLLQKRDRVDIDYTITKQFWLTVKVPVDAEPGEYEGNILFQPFNASSHEIILKLLVLPFRLIGLKDRYQGMYHFCHSTNEFYGIRDKSIEDLKNHGYNLIWMSSRTRVKRLANGKLEFDFGELMRDMQLYKKCGYPGFKAGVLVLQNGLRDSYRLTNEPFGKVGSHQVKESFSKQFDEVYKRMAKAVNEKAREKGYPEFLFYPDGEAGSEGQAGINTAKHLLKLLKEAGVKTHTGINSFSSYQLLPWLDTAAVNDGMHIDETLLKRFKDAGAELWLYNIGNDRFVRGFYFWKTGARAIVKEGYLLRKTVPYNELYREDNEARMTWWDVRPSPDGPVPTLNWEWAREGIDDAKYINTLITLITEGKKSSGSEVAKEAKKAEEMLNEIMEHIKFELSHYTKAVGYWDSDVYDKLRWKIAQRIMILQSLLSKETIYKIDDEEDIDDRIASWWDKHYHYRVPLTINSGMHARKDYLTRQPINFTGLLAGLVVKGTLDDNSIRVIEYNINGDVIREVPSQFNKDKEYSTIAKAKGTLVCVMEGVTPTLTKRYYHIYFDIVENGLKQAPAYSKILGVDRAATTALVLNPGFEIVDEEKTDWPAYWNPHGISPDKRNSRFLTAEEAHTGRYSVKCISDVPRGHNGVETDYFSLKPNTKYLISLWTKVVDANGGYGAAGFLQFYDKNKKNLGWKKRIQIANRGIYDWAKLVVSGISPSDACYGKLQIFSSYGKYTTYFDDVEVKEVIRDEMAPPEKRMGNAERKVDLFP